MLLKALRNGLGYTIAAIDRLTRPKALQRSAEEQQKVDEAVSNMSLYQFYGCPFCIKTRRVIHQLNLPMTYRDAQSPGPWREALLREGGEVKVPCLRIEEAGKVTWMYESSDIIQYLQNRFGA
jgi:glutaredoxin